MNGGDHLLSLLHVHKEHIHNFIVDGYIHNLSIVKHGETIEQASQLRWTLNANSIPLLILGIVLDQVRKPITHVDWPSDWMTVCGSILVNNWVKFIIPFTCIHTLWYKPWECIVFLCGHYLRYKIENKLVNDRK